MGVAGRQWLMRCVGWIFRETSGGLQEGTGPCGRCRFWVDEAAADEESSTTLDGQLHRAHPERVHRFGSSLLLFLCRDATK